MSDTPKPPATRSSRAEIDAFLGQARQTPRPGGGGRLLFALDATASRQPSWDRACQLQAEMFNATADLPALQVQLVYYRGFKEFHRTPWLRDSKALLQKMTGVRCLGGFTQLQRVLKHALAETRQQRVNAVVFVGDALEEAVDPLCHLAGELGLLGVPLFLFQEGRDPKVSNAFAQMAKLSGGAHCQFDEHSAELLRDLLRAVAVFASGGYRALEQAGAANPRVAQLLKQLPAPK